MWIARAVMIGSLLFWVIWRAESILLHLSTTFMGLGATLLPPSPKTCGLDFLKPGSAVLKFFSGCPKHLKNKISAYLKTRLGGSEIFSGCPIFSGCLVLSPNTKDYMELTLLEKN